jgi:hypothetical protein
MTPALYNVKLLYMQIVYSIWAGWVVIDIELVRLSSSEFELAR